MFRQLILIFQTVQPKIYKKDYWDLGMDLQALGIIAFQSDPAHCCKDSTV